MKKLKYLFLIMVVVTFFASAPPVKAELKYDAQRMKLLNRQYSEFPFTTWYAVDEDTTYEGSNYVEFDATNSNITTPNDLPKYVYSIYCSTSDLDLYTSESIKGSMSNYGYVSGGNCQVIHNGNYYNGKYYLNRWLVNQWAYYTGDLGQVYGVKWSIRIRNNNSSNIYVRFESMFVSNEMITDFKSDVLLNQLIEQNSSLKTQLNEIEISTNETNNKLDETNQELGNINDNITNDDVSSNTGNSFFDSFTTNDNGGISAIVTAPLSAIEKMVSGTCTPIKGSYKGKEFSFPCGDNFWADMPDVKQFLNIVLGGFLCYGILAKLYLLIDRLKDPEDDRVDVMKL